MRKSVLVLLTIVFELLSFGATFGQYSKLEGELPAALGPGAKDSIVRAVVLPQIAYPDNALAQLLEGSVWLRLLINEKGKAVNVKVLKDVPDFNDTFGDAAVKFVRQSIYPEKAVDRRLQKYSAYTVVQFELSDSLLQAQGLPLSDQPQAVDLEPQQIAGVDPEFAATKIRRELQGTVSVAELVGLDGRVVTVRIDSSSGISTLDELAMSAVRTKKYLPAKLGENAVARWVHSAVVFEKSAAKKDSLDGIAVAEYLPKFTHFEKAEYPQVEWTNEITGNAKVAGLIDEIGQLIKTRIVYSTGNAALDSAALKAALKHTFTPASTKGVSAKSWISWNVEFNRESKSVHPPGVSSTTEISGPQLLHQEPYDVTDEMSAAGLHGTVTIRAFVNREGSVDTIRVVESSGQPALDSSAVRAVRKYRYAPATKNGAPTGFWLNTSVNFTAKK